MMKRRELIKLFAISGLGVGLFPMISSRSFADTISGGHGKFLVTVVANGGWDTTCLFDPKGKANGVNQVDIDDSLVTANNIRWSAVNPDVENNLRIATQYKNFFTAYSDRLTVIRGMNCLTISHILGSRASSSGMFGTYPSLGALFGAVWGGSLPLSYLTFGGRYGGNDYTAGLKVTKAMLGDGSLLNQMGTPNLAQSSQVYDMVTAAHIERLMHQIEKENGLGGLPLRAQKISELLNERLQPNLFFKVSENIEQLNDGTIFNPDWNKGRAGSLKLQARITASCFAAGITSTANLNVDGFDTHEDNDARQYPLLGDLLEGLHYLIQALEHFNIADKTTILVVSDIGRSRGYNGSEGKDHGIIGGQLIIHPKNSGLGGRVFGESTPEFREQKINFQTGQADANGSILNLRHVLLAHRDLMGLTGTSEASNFSLGSLQTPNIF